MTIGSMTIKRFIRCNENHYDGDAVAITSRAAKKPGQCYFPSLGTEIKVCKTLFSVREGRKIRSCVRYFPSLGTDIQHVRCYFPSPGTEITVWKTLFSVHEGRKIRSCVRYFPSLGTDIQHNRCYFPQGRKSRSGKRYFPPVKSGKYGVAFAIFHPWGRTVSIFLADSQR